MGKVKQELLTEVGCMVCDTLYPRERAALGYQTCTDCGEVEKDYCIDCNVEIFDGGSWGYCTPCSNRVFDKIVSDKLKATNNVKSNHAVGEVYKPQAKLNTHDPHDMHVWKDNKPWWLTPLQVLGFVATGIGLTVCLYYATLILFLL